MGFVQALTTFPFMLYDGPMETRIEYGSSFKLDKEMSIFLLVSHDQGRQVLRELYLGDIEVAKLYDVPIIINAPTFRASPAHCERLLLKELDSVENANKDAISFVKQIRDEYNEFKKKIFITAPIGPKKAGYQPELSFTVDDADEYHSVQAKAIAKHGVDIISIAAMPGMIETVGCARAVARVGLPYSVGVILNGDGTLLDGFSLQELIAHIDENISPPPNFYVISCTHPSTAMQALRDKDPLYARILGIKANGSSLSGKELLKAEHPVADEPEIFAAGLMELGKQFNLKVYGGCCGTDATHLAALARNLAQLHHASLNSR